jgi:hypothetical protein
LSRLGRSYTTADVPLSVRVAGNRGFLKPDDGSFRLLSMLDGKSRRTAREV